MDFERRDFEIEGILSDGIVRANGFCATGCGSRRDFERRDFENEWLLSDGILRTNGF